MLVGVKTGEEDVEEVVSPKSGALGPLDGVHLRKASFALSGAQGKDHPDGVEAVDNVQGVEAAVGEALLPSPSKPFDLAVSELMKWLHERQTLK